MAWQRDAELSSPETFGLSLEIFDKSGYCDKLGNYLDEEMKIVNPRADMRRVNVHQSLTPGMTCL